MATGRHCEGPDGMRPCWYADGQCAVTDDGHCAGCDRFVKDLPHLFNLRPYQDFCDLPRAGWSWRERFYEWRLEHPWWSCGRGSGDGVFFCSAYGDEWWRVILIKPVCEVGRVINSAKRWVKARTFWGMHIIRTDLPPSTYYDPDTQILHAVMACNDRYVGEGWWIIEIEPECIDVAHWWNIDRPADERHREELLEECYGEGRSGFFTEPVPGSGDLVEFKFHDRSPEWHKRNDEYRALEAKIDADETEMLIRIMQVRHRMWI